MDEERALAERFDQWRVRVQPDPYLAIGAGRREQMQRVVTRVHARGRSPRVCRYALSSGGVWPADSLTSLAHFAMQQGWVVPANGGFTDIDGLSDEARPGWNLVRQQVRGGYVDGVVVLTASAISEHPADYQSELNWFAEHLAFIAMIVPEAASRRRT
ncbi:hypothetical protein ACWCWD_22735 [Streptomyces sp. NPDC001493]